MKGLGTMQPTPQQPQQMPVEPKAKEEELERLSEIAKTLEKDLEEVKKRIKELKTGDSLEGVNIMSGIGRGGSGRGQIGGSGLGPGGECRCHSATIQWHIKSACCAISRPARNVGLKW